MKNKGPRKQSRNKTFCLSPQKEHQASFSSLGKEKVCGRSHSQTLTKWYGKVRARVTSRLTQPAQA